MGFSDQTWRLAWRAFLFTGKCEGMEVVLTSRSNGAPANISSMFGYTLGTLNCCARFFARSTMISQSLTTSMKGCEVRFGRYEPETLPQPISPTRILPLGNVVEFAARRFGATPMAVPRTAVSLRNWRRSIVLFGFIV